MVNNIAIHFQYFGNYSNFSSLIVSNIMLFNVETVLAHTEVRKGSASRIYLEIVYLGTAMHTQWILICCFRKKNMKLFFKVMQQIWITISACFSHDFTIALSPPYSV